MKKQDVFIKDVKRKEINLKEYFDVIKNRIWIIIFITMFTTLSGYIYNSFYNNDTLLYKTSTRIIIGADNEYMKTLMVMIKDPTIMEKVKNELQLSRPSEELADQIEVLKVDESTVVSISVIDTDPKMAVSIANETARVFKNEIVNILEFKNVQLLSPAKENPYPINEPHNNIIKITVVLGVILGIGIAFLLDSLDETIKRESEIEEILEVPVIGIVSNMNKKKLLGEKKKYKSINSRGETLDV